MNIFAFLQLQLDRVRGKPTGHAPGPKRPTLAQTDLGLVPKTQKKS